MNYVLNEWKYKEYVSKWMNKELNMTANYSTPFLSMAARIDTTNASEFGGALVLIAPDGKKLEFLLTNPNPELVSFWGFVRSSIEDVWNTVQKEHATGMGFPHFPVR